MKSKYIAGELGAIGEGNKNCLNFPRLFAGSNHYGTDILNLNARFDLLPFAAAAGLQGRPILDAASPTGAS